MMQLNTNQIKVWVTVSYMSVHCWPEAPEIVAILRYPHRHVFQVRLQVISQKDRAVEFLQLKAHLGEACDTVLRTLRANNTLSCESQAEIIIKTIQDKNYTVDYCEVSEDGENGAIVQVIPNTTLN